MPTFADVYAAQQVIRRYLPPTPLLPAPRLSALTRCDVYVKCEQMSPIRSFKARGAIYCLSRLGSAESGVVCASTGNHGQGVAFAAALFGKRAVVVVPRSTTEQKVAAIRRLGADLRVHGADLTESTDVAKRIAAGDSLVYVEDGEHPDVLAGCATLGIEIVEQLPDVRRLFVPVGAGNLIAACALSVNALRPDALLTGVQSDAAPTVYESWRAGRLVRADRCATFAGGLATSAPGAYTFPYLLRGVDEMLLVPDTAIVEAAVVMLRETGMLPEGAGAAGLAALLAEPARYASETVVLLLTGSNYEPAIWDAVRAGG